MLRDEGQSAKPGPFGGVQETPLRLPRRRAALGAAGSPGDRLAEILPLCHGQHGTVLGPHPAPLKSSHFEC